MGSDACLGGSWNLTVPRYNGWAGFAVKSSSSSLSTTTGFLIADFGGAA
jgi:hypothetical protein